MMADRERAPDLKRLWLTPVRRDISFVAPKKSIRGMHQSKSNRARRVLARPWCGLYRLAAAIRPWVSITHTVLEVPMRATCVTILAIAVGFLSRGGAADPQKPGKPPKATKPPAGTQTETPPAESTKTDKPAAKPYKFVAPLYYYNYFPGLLSNAKVKEELKVTKGQTPAYEAAQNRWRDGFVKRVDPKPGQPIDFVAINKENYDGMIALLSKTLDEKQMKRLVQLIRQMAGIDLFEHKEIQDALELTPEDVTRLKKIHDQCWKETGDFSKGKQANEEARKRHGDLTTGVTGKVRESLTDEQQKKLQELIGDQFSFK